MHDTIKDIREIVEGIERRVSGIGANSSSAAIHVSGGGALAIAGLWVSALLLVIAAAMAFVCWQKAEHIAQENARLNDRVDMLEARAFATDTAIRQMRKPQ